VDWQKYLHDPKVLAGGAAAAAVGAYVLYQRKKTTGSTLSGGSPAATAPASSYGGVGTFSSTGTDLASFLGNYSGALQTQLDQYSKQLTDSLSALQQSPAPTGSGTGGFTSNDQWAQAAMQWLSDRTHFQLVTPLNAQTAIGDYLAGRPLGDWEKWTIDPIIGGGQVNLVQFPWQKTWGAGIGAPPSPPGR
jgi:hypothetical protein